MISVPQSKKTGPTPNITNITYEKKKEANNVILKTFTKVHTKFGNQNNYPNQNQNNYPNQHEILKTEGDEFLIEKEEEFTPLDHLTKLIDGEDNSINSIEDGKVSRYNFQRYQYVEKSCTYFSLLGIILSVFQYQSEITDHDNIENIILLWTILITTVSLVVLTILKYKMWLIFKISQKTFFPKDNLVSSKLINSVILELIFIIPSPFIGFNGIKIPGYDYYNQLSFEYSLNSLFSLYILTRLLVLSNMIFNQTKYASHRSQRICKMYGCEANSAFALKCIMKISPIPLIVILFVLTIIIFGHAVRICERKEGIESQNFGYYFNSMWIVIVTMTTVGYGDYFPTSVLGRFILFLVCIWGIFIISLMVITLNNTLSLNVLENKAMSLIIRLVKRQELRIIAGYILASTAKFCLLIKKKKSEKNNKNNQENKGLTDFATKLKKKFDEFKNLRRQIREMSGSNTLQEELESNFFYLTEDLKIIENDLDEQKDFYIKLANHLNIDCSDILNKNKTKEKEKEEEEKN